MDHRKGIASESSASIREFTKWTTDMNFRLLSAMIDEVRLGNRVDGSWTTQAYNNIVTALFQLGWVGITKNNVKNRHVEASSCIATASSSGSKRRRAVRTRGGKSRLRDDVGPGFEMGGVEDLLNQTRFFNERDQMIQYATQLYERKIHPPKVMNLPWFRKEGFQFQNHLLFANIFHAPTCLL